MAEILTAKGFENYVPSIELVDRTPTEESPTDHTHCDICETPVNKVVSYQEVPVVFVSTGETPPPQRLCICPECLIKGIKLLGL